MPPRRRARTKKFKLGIRDLRQRLAKAEAVAAKAVAAGEKSVKAAKKTKDAAAIKTQEGKLRDARRAKENLGQAVHLLALSCCDQFLNCDPEFM